MAYTAEEIEFFQWLNTPAGAAWYAQQNQAPAPEPEPVRTNTWEQNKNYIIQQVNAGTADAAEQAWYDTWVQAGSPDNQADLQAWKAENWGVHDDVVTYWNPDIQGFQTDPFDPDGNYRAGFKNSDYGYYINSQGDYVYGKKPENTWQYYDGDGYITVEGENPNPSNPPPSQHGMAPDGGQFFGDPNDPNNTGNLTDQPGYEPPISYDPFNPTNPPPALGGGGSTPPPDGGTPPPGGGTPPPTDGGGGGGAFDWMNWGVADNPLIGWEQSSNQDFYQQQFKDMRDRQDNERTREFVAALKRDASMGQPAPDSDPWEAFGGSEQFTPVSGSSGTGERVLKPQYEGLTNQEILASSGYGAKADDWYNRLLTENPNLADQTNWQGAGYNTLINQVNTGGLNEQNKKRMTNLFNEIYTGTPTTPGGFNVPAGYASPINA